MKILLPFTNLIIIFVTIIISNTLILYKENKFEKVYSNISNIEAKAIIESQIIEKENFNEFTIKIIECEKNEKIEKTRLIVTCNKKYKLKYGDTIQITGNFKEIGSYKNKGVFNYKEFLKIKNIYGKVEIKNIEKLKENSKISIKIKERIKEKIDRNFSENSRGILKALLINDKAELSEETKENFQENGLAHILAISGMHVNCIIIIFQMILNQLTSDTKLKKIILIFILILFWIIIGFSASISRAMIMAILLLSSKIIYKRSNNLINISLASLIILIYNPYYITDSGFLLSFVATLGILYVYPLINNKIKVEQKIFKYFLEIFLVSIAVNITIFPIVIYKFKRISISSIITGLIMNPLVFIIEILGLLSIFLPNFILPIISPMIELIISIFLFIAKIDIGKFYFKVMNILEISLYYLILIYMIQKQYQKKLKHIIKIIILILITTILLNYLTIYLNKELIINFIDVGQGDSILITTEEKKHILIDGGGNENYDIGANVIIPYLLSKKIDSLDYIIISHFDNDHVRPD